METIKWLYITWLTKSQSEYINKNIVGCFWLMVFRKLLVNTNASPSFNNTVIMSEKDIRIA